METAVFVFGLIALVLWIVVLVVLSQWQCVMDRILSAGRYWHIGVILFFIGIMPFAIASVAHMAGVQSYDLLGFERLYGDGQDQDDAAGYAEGGISAVGDSLTLARETHRDAIRRKMNEQAEDPSLVGTVFFHFRGIGGQYSAGTPRGRQWGLIIGIIGTLLFSGFLIPTLVDLTWRRGSNWTRGNVRYNFRFSRYAVIFGNHEMVPELIHRLLADPKIQYVIVQTEGDIPAFRAMLQGRLRGRDEWRVILYHGGRSEVSDIVPLHLERAQAVYVMGEQSDREWESSRDAISMQCVNNMAAYLHFMRVERKCRRKDPTFLMPCYVMLEYQTSMTAFYMSDVTDEVRHEVEFIPFNLYKNWARRVWWEHGIDGGKPMQQGSPRYCHLVVVGMTKMGVALALEAAHLAHYPNAIDGIRTRITFIDGYAEGEMHNLCGRYSDLMDLSRHRYCDLSGREPRMGEWQVPEGENMDFLDVEWQFIRGRIEDPQVRQWLVNQVDDPNAIVSVAVCLNQTNPCIAAGIYLPREVLRKAEQVILYQRTTSDIVDILSGTAMSDDKRQQQRYGNVRSFGVLRDLSRGPLVDYTIAKMINYVYNRMDDVALEHLNDIDPESGLPLQEKFWRQCSIADKWSSQQNGRSFRTKLRSFGLDMDTASLEEMRRVFSDPDVLDRMMLVEHNRWNIEKLLTGFRGCTVDEKRHFLSLRQSDMKEFGRQKKALKNGWEKAHLDILSFDELKVLDPETIPYDRILIEAIPNIVNRWRQEREQMRQRLAEIGVMLDDPILHQDGVMTRNQNLATFQNLVRRWD